MKGYGVDYKIDGKAGELGSEKQWKGDQAARVCYQSHVAGSRQDAATRY